MTIPCPLNQEKAIAFVTSPVPLEESEAGKVKGRHSSIWTSSQLTSPDKTTSHVMSRHTDELTSVCVEKQVYILIII